MSQTYFFVACPSFHGATLFALLLNNHSRLSCLGDTLPSVKFDQVCSCGEHASRCDFWQEIHRRLDWDRFEGGEWTIPSLPRLVGNQLINRQASRGMARLAHRLGPWVWNLMPAPRDEFLEVCDLFAKTVTELNGTSVFIDGHKDLIRAEVLRSILGRDADVRLIQVIRDPRGFAASCRRYEVLSPRAAVAFWSRYLRRSLRFRKELPDDAYLSVRYEDLATEPAQVMERVFEFIGVPNEAVCSVPKYPEKHHLIGNKMLFEFDGTIRLDSRWKKELSPEEQRQVLRAAGPLAARYGYDA